MHYIKVINMEQIHPSREKSGKNKQRQHEVWSKQVSWGYKGNEYQLGYGGSGVKSVSSTSYQSSPHSEIGRAHV